MHEANTLQILEEEGLQEIAQITMHGFTYEFTLLIDKIDNPSYLPQTLENKIVALADMYYNQNEQRVSLTTWISLSIYLASEA